MLTLRGITASYYLPLFKPLNQCHPMARFSISAAVTEQCWPKFDNLVGGGSAELRVPRPQSHWLEARASMFDWRTQPPTSSRCLNNTVLISSSVLKSSNM